MLRKILQCALFAVRKAKLRDIRMDEAMSVPPPSGTCEKSPEREDRTDQPINTSEKDVGTDRSSEKRRPSSEENSAQDGSKKMKTDDETTEKPYVPFKKKKMLMMMVYSGQGYLGMQRNPDVKTIEGDLLIALVRAGVVTEDQAADPGRRMHFQRAARTDKGVSAAGQSCSLNMFVDVEQPLEKINSHLVDQIRVIALQRVTKKFDSKNAADARTYFYMMPTFAFTPYQQFVLESFRITDEISQKVSETLQLFKGTHNFHNFTSGKKSTDHSAKRYIMDFTMGPPFVKDGIEFVVLTVKGQSFMLHQIRKMIGITIAIVRGLTGVEAVQRAYSSHGKCDIPKAPGLGLVLDRVHYDFYNRKYGKDGLHQPILWETYHETIEAFKQEHIYPTIIKTEKEERSMMKWLSTLHLHHFEEKNPSVSTLPETAMVAAHRNLTDLEKREAQNKDLTEMPVVHTSEDTLQASSIPAASTELSECTEEQSMCENAHNSEDNLQASSIPAASTELSDCTEEQLMCDNAHKSAHSEDNSTNSMTNTTEEYVLSSAGPKQAFETTEPS